MAAQWEAVRPIVILNRIERRIVVQTWDTPTPQSAEELLETLSGGEVDVELCCAQRAIAMLLLRRKAGNVRFVLREAKTMQIADTSVVVHDAPYAPEGSDGEPRVARLVFACREIFNSCSEAHLCPAPSSDMESFNSCSEAQSLCPDPTLNTATCESWSTAQALLA